MNGLSRNAKRDAWATVRGFSYQIKTTVLRWLELSGNTVLLCECGEDISRIREYLDSVTKVKEVEQLLEQVKHRQRAVTLASPEVIETLASLHAARQGRSDRIVLLRYTTNAPIGRERRPSFGEGMRGIEAWQRSASGAASPDEVRAFLTAFRGLVAGVRVRKPQSKTGRKLNSFQRFVASASDDELAGFVNAVEWAVSQPPHREMQRRIEEEVVRRGLAPPASAQAAAAKLVVVALDALSRRGLKLLDRPLLLRCLEDLHLSSTEAALLAGLQRIEERLSLLPGIASDIRELKATSSRMEAKIDALAPGVAIPAETGAAVAGIAWQPSPPLLDSSPLPPHPNAARESLVGSLEARLTALAWLHLAGGAGMGKTHLARALAERAGLSDVLWISLGRVRDQAGLLAHLREQTVAWVCAETREPSWWPAYGSGQVSVPHLFEATLARRSARTLVVVDDIPDLIETPELRHLLSDLALACLRTHARLVTTGQRRLTPQAVEPLAPSSVAHEDVPKMGADDAMEMLLAAGAATHACNAGFASFLCSVARGHPSLLSATIRWCSERNWRFQEGDLTALFAGQASADTRETAIRQMLRLVPNDSARELLLRLSLLGRSFGRRELEAVAGVSPSLSRPGELLLELVGPWVNRLDNNQWEISPLLSNAGATTLPIGSQRGVHLALARTTLAAASLTFLEGVQVIVDLMMAHAWHDAAALMTHILTSVKTQADAAAVFPLTLVFTPGSAWPDEISVGQRIVIRAFQARATYLDGRDAANLQQDLDLLIGRAGDCHEEQLGVLIALLNAGPFVPESPPAVATRRALQAARLLRARPDLASGLPRTLPNWEEFVLFPVGHVRDLNDVRDVLEVLREMSDSELHAAFDSDLGTQSLQALADCCWTSVYRLPEGERDWDAVLGILGDLSDLAAGRGHERLATVAACAEAITLADHLGRSEDGLHVLNQLAPADPMCQFLLRNTMACILFDTGRHAECVESVEIALRAGGTGFTNQRYLAFQLACEASGRLQQWSRAANWARRGIRYARTHRFRPAELSAPEAPQELTPEALARRREQLLGGFVLELNRLELTGDLALALWYAGERRRSWDAMFGLVRELSDAWNPKDRRYREVFRKTGHVLGWLSSMSATGAPPTATSDGGEYAVPWLGIFVRQREELADVATPLSRSLLWYLLGVMAAGVGLRRTSLRSLRRAMDMAAAEGQLPHRHMALFDIAVISAALGLFGESLDAALDAIKLFPSAREYVTMQEEIPASFPDPAKAWKELPQERKCAAQEELFWLTIGPAILSLLTSDRDSALLARWRDAFHERKSELANPEYWDLVIDAAQMVVEPAQRFDINAYWNTMSLDDTALIQTLCFAIPEAVGARPEDVVYPHGLLMAQVLMRRTITKFVFDELSTYVISYWANVAAAKAFQLRLPSQFKERMASLSSRRDLATACQVILWAEEATGASMPADIRQKLQEEVGHAGT